jgi:hypothetical protein
MKIMGRKEIGTDRWGPMSISNICYKVNANIWYQSGTDPRDSQLNRHRNLGGVSVKN